MGRVIEFDHSCKQTCSGWKQGYERGVREERDRLLAENEAMRVVVNSVKWAESQEYHSEDCPAGYFDDEDFDREKCDCGLKEIQDALAAVRKLESPDAQS
jgi:hypothetical protein